MSGVHYPAHRLCFASSEEGSILLAARGSSVLSLSFPQGHILTQWPRDEEDDTSDEDEQGNEQEGRRPNKRQKLSRSSENGLQRHDSEASEVSIEIVAEGQKRQKGERRRPKIPDTTLPNVSHLITTSDGKYAIAITSEDKTVRVFSISRRGRLRQTSARPMPKKCCAISLTADGKTVLTADKFGDVYALPLHPTPDWKPDTTAMAKREAFKPSASELTVHTKGNLDALRQQQAQKHKQVKKEGPIFEHKLLLGHVSLLTDLAVAKGPVNGEMRQFILTSDRDEHIRVSRGIPQTHVIHNFCLGHLEFVSKLCILPWDERVLVAGNGEPSLRVYDWQNGQQQGSFDVLAHLRQDIEGVLSPTRAPDKLAVSAIWPISLQGTGRTLLVALEALPLLFSFQVMDYDLCLMQTLKLEGNVLDVVQCYGQNVLAVAIDTVHESGSYKDYRPHRDKNVQSIQFFNIRGAEMIINETTTEGLYLDRSDSIQPWDIRDTQQDTAPSVPAREADVKSKDYERAYSTIGEFVYGLENLRKRRGRAAEGEEDGEGQEDDPEPEEVSDLV